MTQSQRARYFKTGGVISFVLFLLYYISGPSVIRGTTSKLSDVLLDAVP